MLSRSAASYGAPWTIKLLSYWSFIRRWPDFFGWSLEKRFNGYYDKQGFLGSGSTWKLRVENQKQHDSSSFSKDLGGFYMLATHSSFKDSPSDGLIKIYPPHWTTDAISTCTTARASLSDFGVIPSVILLSSKKNKQVLKFPHPEMQAVWFPIYLRILAWLEQNRIQIALQPGGIFLPSAAPVREAAPWGEPQIEVSLKVKHRDISLHIQATWTSLWSTLWVNIEIDRFSYRSYLLT